MAVIKAQRCFLPRSSWVHAFILTCDDRLAVWFKKYVHHHHGVVHGGVPGVCCYYPATGLRHYELALVWGSAGKFVHHFLFRKLGYQVVRPPTLPCRCRTTVSVSSSKNPSCAGDSVTFTATVTNADGSAPPQGSVEFFDGGTDLGPGTALTPDPTSTLNPATSTFTTSSLAVGSHTITAQLTGADTVLDGFKDAQGSVSQTVNDCGVDTTCCHPTNVPSTLHATFSNGTGSCSCFNGLSFAMTYDSVNARWSASGLTICGLGTNSLLFQCNGATWGLQGTGACSFQGGGATAVCSPFSVSFTTLSVSPVCCNGAIDVTVTP
jgi:hypothetical protein